MKRLFGVAGGAARAAATGHQQQQHREWIGRELVVGRHHVAVEEVVAEGGFALVFLVKSRIVGGNGNGGGYTRLALKRMCVNNETDLRLVLQDIRNRLRKRSMILHGRDPFRSAIS